MSEQNGFELAADRGGSRYRWDGTGLRPGDELLACASGFDLAAAFEEFQASTGLPDEALYSSSCLACPIPDYLNVDGDVDPDEAATGYQALWVDYGVAAAMLWHPLFWLPDWLHPTPDEERETWAVRVGLVLQARGLYDPDLGWRDILYDYGIDTTDPLQLEPVGRWLIGDLDTEDKDPLTAQLASRLDTVSLIRDLPAEPAEQAGWAEAAIAAAGPVLQRSWVLIAEDLLAFAGDIDPADGDSSLELQEIIDVAASCLLETGIIHTQVMAVADSDEADVYTESPGEFWARIEAELGAGGGQTAMSPRTADRLLSEMKDWLVQVRGQYWTAVQELAGSGS